MGKGKDLPLLRGPCAVQLAMPPLRFRHLPELHGRELLGDELQRDYLAVSGLWGAKRFRQPMMGGARRA
ncbi:MAG: hypothetical protein ACOWWM_18820, partial [Desulfobacterales bacterium]